MTIDTYKYYMNNRNTLTKDECLEKYLSGKTLIEIHKETGIPRKTLSGWCRSGNWVQLKQNITGEPLIEQIQLEKQAEAKIKVEEHVNKEIATRYVEASVEQPVQIKGESPTETINKNVEAMRLVRNYSKTVIQLYATDLQQSMQKAKTHDERMKYVHSIETYKVKAWVDMLCKSTDQLEIALGLRYLSNVNQAASLLESQGYKIVEGD